MPPIKEHWVFRGGSWNTPGLKTEASEHQSFPLGWQALAEERKRFSSRYFESQGKKPHELMRILRRMILPKNTIVSTGFFWQISAAPSDCMKLCVWLNLFISAFWSSVSVTVALCIQLLCRLGAPDTHCYSALCFQHYSCEIPPLSKHLLSLP